MLTALQYYCEFPYLVFLFWLCRRCGRSPTEPTAPAVASSKRRATPHSGSCRLRKRTPSTDQPARDSVPRSGLPKAFQFTPPNDRTRLCHDHPPAQNFQQKNTRNTPDGRAAATCAMASGDFLMFCVFCVSTYDRCEMLLKCRLCLLLTTPRAQ